MPFQFRHLDIPEIVLILPCTFEDDRGIFLETYKYSDFSKAGVSERFVQDNYSQSSKSVLRGLHYQKYPNSQGKLVRCVQGEIFDVAVDIRQGSPTYGKWIGIVLSERDKQLLYIPSGFAHGFLVLSDIAGVIYKCTEEYVPESDRGIAWNDPDIRIDWPVKRPLLSEKDRSHPLLRNADNNFFMQPAAELSVSGVHYDQHSCEIPNC